MKDAGLNKESEHQSSSPLPQSISDGSSSKDDDAEISTSDTASGEWERATTSSSADSMQQPFDEVVEAQVVTSFRTEVSSMMARLAERHLAAHGRHIVGAQMKDVEVDALVAHIRTELMPIMMAVSERLKREITNVIETAATDVVLKTDRSSIYKPDLEAPQLSASHVRQHEHETSKPQVTMMEKRSIPGLSVIGGGPEDSGGDLYKFLLMCGLSHLNATSKGQKPYQDDTEWNALVHAAYSGRTDIARILLATEEFERVNDPTGKNRGNALHAACVNGQAKVAQLLLESDRFVGVNIRNRFHMTPFADAAYGGNAECVRVMLECPKVDIVNPPVSPLHIAVSEGHSAVIAYLLEHDSDHANAHCHGQTALHVAPTADAADLLLKHPSFTSANAVDKNGNTALHIAAFRNKTGVLISLLKSPRFTAEGELNNAGMTALHAAATRGHLEVVQILLTSTNVDASLRDKNGQTALQIANKARHLKIISVLSEHAARRHSTNI